MGPEISFEPDDKYHDDNNHDDAYYGDYADAESDAYADDDANATENSYLSTQVKIRTKCSQSQILALGCVSPPYYVTTLLLLLSHHCKSKAPPGPHFWLEA